MAFAVVAADDVNFARAYAQSIVQSVVNRTAGALREGRRRLRTTEMASNARIYQCRNDADGETYI